VVTKRDFLEYANFGHVKIPVRYGEKVGTVNSILQNSRSISEAADYFRVLKDAIEKQKYYDSLKGGFDVGPATAVANFVKSGSYDTLFREFEEKRGLKLSEVERILEVEEGNEIYHVLSKRSFHAFKMAEEGGLMQVSLYWSMRNAGINRTEEAIKWVDKNCAAFRDTLDSSRIIRIHGQSERYDGIFVFKDLCKNLVERLSLDETQVEAADPMMVMLENHRASHMTPQPQYAVA